MLLNLLIFGLALAWAFIVAGCWLGWQLLRQNGRLLLRLEELEKGLHELEFGEGDHPSALTVGVEAPGFELPDLEGKQHTLSQYRGQSVLLIFFNPACGFCRELAPKLANVAAGFQLAVEGGILPPGELAPPHAARPNSHDNSPRDASPAGLEARLNGSQRCQPLQVLIVSTGTAEANRTLFAQQKVSWPVLLQKEDEVAASYQANGTPSGYWISPEGKIASELAMGGDAIRELMGRKTKQPKVEVDQGLLSSNGGEGEEQRNNRFTERTLARSKIKRDGLKAGTVAPEFRLPRLDGRGDLALSDLRGKPVLLVFSSPHCGPCNALATELEKFHRAHTDLKLVMISKGESKENRAKVKEHGLTFPIVLQQQWEISRRYAMFATPVAYLIDEMGVIINDVAVGMDRILALLAQASTKTNENALTSGLVARETSG
jgi:peroxiredoxin